MQARIVLMEWGVLFNIFLAAGWCLASCWESFHELAEASHGKIALQPWGKPLPLLDTIFELIEVRCIIKLLTCLCPRDHSSGLLLFLVLSKLLNILRSGLDLLSLLRLGLARLGDLPHSTNLQLSVKDRLQRSVMMTYLGCGCMTPLQINLDICHDSGIVV